MISTILMYVVVVVASLLCTCLMLHTKQSRESPHIVERGLGFKIFDSLSTIGLAVSAVSLIFGAALPYFNTHLLGLELTIVIASVLAPVFLYFWPPLRLFVIGILVSQIARAEHGRN